MHRGIQLRTKFLLSSLAMSAGLTAATPLVVSYSVERGVREALREELRNSVKTYQTFDQQREATLSRSTEMLANLPSVRALMTTEEGATILDESKNIWRISGGDHLILTNRTGDVVGFQTKPKRLTREKTQELLRESVQREEPPHWWHGGGYLYQVWLQPIYLDDWARHGHRRSACRARD